MYYYCTKILHHLEDRIHFQILYNFSCIDLSDKILETFGIYTKTSFYREKNEESIAITF